MKRCLIIINPSSGKHIIQNKLDRIIGQLTLQNIVEHFVMKINMILSCLLVVMVL